MSENAEELGSCTSSMWKLKSSVISSCSLQSTGYSKYSENFVMKTLPSTWWWRNTATGIRWRHKSFRKLIFWLASAFLNHESLSIGAVPPPRHPVRVWSSILQPSRQASTLVALVVSQVSVIATTSGLLSQMSLKKYQTICFWSIEHSLNKTPFVS